MDNTVDNRIHEISKKTRCDNKENTIYEKQENIKNSLIIICVILFLHFILKLIKKL